MKKSHNIPLTCTFVCMSYGNRYSMATCTQVKVHLTHIEQIFEQHSLSIIMIPLSLMKLIPTPTSPPYYFIWQLSLPIFTWQYFHFVLPDEVPIDLAGDAPYPKRRLRKVQIDSDCFEIYNKDVRIKVEGAVEAKVVLTFNTRKLVVSDEHEHLFLKSLMWPVSESKCFLKLRKVKGQLLEAKPCESIGRPRLRNYLQNVIHYCTELPIEYHCFVCNKWHDFPLMHMPLYTPADLHMFSKHNMPAVEITSTLNK